MNTASMQTGFSSSDQAAQVIAFAQHREQAAMSEAFTDNLDHLQALEYETKLMLADAFMHSCQQKNTQPDAQWSEYRLYFPFLPPEASLEQVNGMRQKTVEENRQREAKSARQGIELLFPAFCSNLRLEEFERAVVLLLFMKSTAPQFIDIFRKCQFEDGNYDGMEIGSLLTIISDSLRDHLENRRYFSVDASLKRSSRDSLFNFCQPSSQSSISNPSTRENSRALCVTTTAPWTSAVAAIIRSFGPIGVPCRASNVRTSPYFLAVSSSKRSESKLAKNSSSKARLSAKRLLFIAP